MYEHKRQLLAPPAVFYRRVSRNLLIGIGILFVCLLIGIAGYHYTARSGWMDSLHNTSMILSDMGPVIEISTKGGKLFSSFYALFSGVVFITNIGIITAPIIHRIFHKFHLEDNAPS